VVLPYNAVLKQAAQKLRREMTDAERRLWARLRGRQILGTQFYRQKPVGKYIVDFYCPVARLVVEVDGAQHCGAREADKDQMRTAFLETLGLTVIRFDNRQVLTQLEDVVAEVYRVIADKIPPSPPFAKGGETE
jgi:very-short-patch-repair endonuclease